MTRTCLASVAAALLFSATPIVAQEEAASLISNIEIDPSGIAYIQTAPSDQTSQLMASRALGHWQLSGFAFPRGAEENGLVRIPLSGDAEGAPYFFALEPLADEYADEEILAQWELWRSRRPADYRITVSSESFIHGTIPAPPETRIIRARVEGDRVAEVRDLENGQALDLSEGLFWAVEELFRDALFLRATQGAEIDFDPVFGYPERIEYGDVDDGEYGTLLADLSGESLRLVDQLPTDETMRDPFAVDGLQIMAGHLLVIDATFPTCDTSENALYAVEGDIVERDPLRINLYVTHHDSGVNCQAFTQGRMVFDLRPLRDRLIALYGAAPGIELDVYSQIGDDFDRVGGALYLAAGAPLQIVEEQPTNVNERSFIVHSARIDSPNTLAIGAIFPDCDTSNNSLIALPVFFESNPPQIDLYLRHHGFEGGACQAVTHDTLFFDLTALNDLLLAENGELIDVTLRLNTVIDGEVGQIDTLLYEPREPVLEGSGAANEEDA